MAIRTVVTRGFGNGTYNGTIALVVTRGYAIGEAASFVVLTPAKRIFSIASESRIYAIGEDNRTFAVPSDDRTTGVD